MARDTTIRYFFALAAELGYCPGRRGEDTDTPAGHSKYCGLTDWVLPFSAVVGITPPPWAGEFFSPGSTGVLAWSDRACIAVHGYGNGTVVAALVLTSGGVTTNAALCTRSGSPRRMQKSGESLPYRRLGTSSSQIPATSSPARTAFSAPSTDTRTLRCPHAPHRHVMSCPVS